VIMNSSKKMGDKIKILPFEYLEPCIAASEKCDITNNTYVIHKHGKSWVPNYMNSLYRIYYDYKIALLITVLLLIVFVIFLCLYLFL
ncbi:MAG: hypothetical protein Terrestrivirus12_37, partial [Terrestrivirus sp.]